MRHHHRWPYILLPLLLLPSLPCTPFPHPKTRHHQRQLHRLVGGHLRTIDPDPNDSELITASAGEDSPSKKGGGGDGGEERKTLSQQVADGKYGLIQKELFRKLPKRPGILSYAANPEVPNDNIATLGGLTKNDIWLAENHLLVIKGGTYPPYDDKKEFVSAIWQPIDDYSAPLHQVKIPKNPKIPPPFPVQLTEDGPLQILGTNSSRTLNVSAEAPAYALPPPEGWDPIQNPYFPQEGSPNTDPSHAPPGQTALRDPGQGPGEPPGGLPFPPALLNGSWPPFFAHLPPGAAILPPPGNGTEPIDEDDPSIYYPPPYSFFYPMDNSSLVPAGPLVPGIILPPPPNFFAPLEEEPRTTTTKKPARTKITTQPPRKTYTTTTEEPLSNEVPGITTKKPFKTVPTSVSVIKNYSKVTVKVTQSRKPMAYSRTPSRIPPQTTKLIKTTIPTTGRPKLITILPVHVDKLNRTYLPSRTVVQTRKNPSVTRLSPVNLEVATPKVFVYNNEVSGRPFDNRRPSYAGRNEYDSQKVKYNGVVSSTQVPLKYYTTSVDIQSNLVTQAPEKFSIGIRANVPTTTPQTPANFYFYEEGPQSNPYTTKKPFNPNQNGYYDAPNPHYLPIDVEPQTPAPPVVRRPPQPKPQYIYVTGRPYESPRPKFRYVPQNVPQKTTSNFGGQQNLPQKTTSGFGLPQKNTNTFSIHIAQLQNQLHQYYTTPSAVVNRPSPKPVYQYSFEAANYRRPGGKTFRPSPLLDDNEDHFRPIPKYSVQIQPAIEIIPTQQPSYQQIQPLNVEEPQYFTTERPQYPHYHEEPQKNQGFGVTSKPISEYSFEPTPNPIFQGYYTKPDEGYFDENTKKYFTIFGRKLPSGTTPIPSVAASPTHRYRAPQSPRYKPQDYDRPISLHSDINVNYVKPRPQINPQSESIPSNGGQYHRERIVVPQNPQGNNPEVVKAIEIEPPDSVVNGRGEKDRYIHYQLPGDDGAHFYFLTPQLADRSAQRGEYYVEGEERGRLRRDDGKKNR